MRMPSFVLAASMLMPGARVDSISLVAGGGLGGEGSAAKSAELKSPFGLVETPSGSIVFVEMTGHRVREIDARGRVGTIAGTGREGRGGDGGPAERAEFNGMHALAVAKDGDLFIAETWNNRVRRIDAATREIGTVIGTGEKGFSGDGGKATEARFEGIYSIALSPDGGRMYVADLDNRRVRSIDMRTGIVSTVARDGTKGAPADGSRAAGSPLVDPRAVAVDPEGNLYILERSGHALRVVDRAGKIRTVVGTGEAGNAGDVGPGAAALLNGHKDLAVDRDGTVLITDTENHVIRRYDPKQGTISLVAGTGKKGRGGLGGKPRGAGLFQPHGVAVCRDGSILVSDSGNHRILRIGRSR